MTNHLTIQADEPGVYEGQCKEFCGLSHAYMKFKVVAHTPADFERWVAEQKAPASPDVSGPAEAGKQIFLQTCIACHAVAGLETANGQPVLANGGPNLTHLMSRECFRGCTLDDQRGEPAALDRGPALDRGGFVHARLRAVGRRRSIRSSRS